jgi:hypothetical protein
MELTFSGILVFADSTHQPHFNRPSIVHQHHGVPSTCCPGAKDGCYWRTRRSVQKNYQVSLSHCHKRKITQPDRTSAMVLAAFLGRINHYAGTATFRRNSVPFD